jgi:hypothetical protein
MLLCSVNQVFTDNSPPPPPLVVNTTVSVYACLLEAAWDIIMWVWGSIDFFVHAAPLVKLCAINGSTIDEKGTNIGVINLVS